MREVVGGEWKNMAGRSFRLSSRPSQNFYRAIQPPSAVITAPLMSLDSSLARYRARLAMSMGQLRSFSSPPGWSIDRLRPTELENTRFSLTRTGGLFPTSEQGQLQPIGTEDAGIPGIPRGLHGGVGQDTAQLLGAGCRFGTVRET